MGTFGSYTGAEEIPADKIEEFSEAVSKILFYGGMMLLRNVEMFGKKILLLDPVIIHKGEDVDFHYNYFEDDSWENAYYTYGSQHLQSGKIGGQEFCDVITAVRCLYEMYDAKPGVAKIGGEIVQSECYIGWINNILGTRFSLKRRFRLWDQMEAYALQKHYEPDISIKDIGDLLPKHLMKYAGGTDLADLLNVINGTKTLTEENVQPGTYPDDVLKCKRTVERILEEKGVEEGYDAILRLVKETSTVRKEEVDAVLKPLADMSLYMPARVLVYLADEHLGKKFWREWKELRDEAYHDEELKEYASDKLKNKREDMRQRPVEPIRTAEALRQTSSLLFWNTPDEIRNMPRYYLSDDDRLYWWDGSDEVVTSRDGNTWLENTKTKYDEMLERVPDEYDTQGFVKGLIELLFDIEERYKRVFAFQEMFFEFISNGSKKEYRAAIDLLRQYHDDYAEDGKIIKKVSNWSLGNRNVKCNSGRMRMRAYLSLLANKKLRLKCLGF